MQKRIVSGIQSSGILTLGNYLGAVRNWVNLQSSNDCYYFIADHHAITTRLSTDTELASGQNMDQLVLNTAACLLACGVDPKKAVLFNQSHVSEHCELMWILSCMTPLSWLNKMIQFKEKSKNNNIAGTGLLTYPILMAADILLYKAQHVPVGEDQIQHVELTRDVAIRLNKICRRDVVPVPSPLILPESSKIMSLQNGRSKMSKSDPNTHSCLSLITTEEEIGSKIRKAKTDSINKIEFKVEERPEVSNLINIYSSLTGLTVKEVESKFTGASTVEFKNGLTSILLEKILPISDKARLLIDKEVDYVKDILYEGKVKATAEARSNLDEIKSSLNFLL